MEITVNQQVYQVTDTCNVQQMLTIVFEALPKGIAVAINQTIIPRASWADHQISPQDQIVIIKATQGG
ncbi:sulfur carrier protein ThiS [Mucilaginibacter lappiensis]|uniref:Sulfur carrier protein n=1 Tax=Mucilaginibacter lappiensis TaxID=354630 RepID=A0A841JE48_9SPHI|nr:sulfur carrier protein ThiS [Mucilaginibacter lappiensis]MBB6108051.1 sulfur carrier protein [Mucilaginibacter lappiensis]MBB6127856.1 sulfur carrier protein [Mucilaginibacter lappiensis]